jgi:hypothetical protein
MENSLYNVLKNAGHTDDAIERHIIACACTMVLMAQTGLPAEATKIELTTVAMGKLGVTFAQGAAVVSFAAQLLIEDPEFLEYVKKQVASNPLSARLLATAE